MSDNIIIKTGVVAFLLSLFVVLLLIAQDILFPIAVGFFFTYLLYPFVDRIEKKGVNRVVAIFIVMLIALLILSSVGIFLSISFSNISVDFTEIREQLNNKFDIFLNGLEGVFGINVSTMEGFLEKLSNDIFSSWDSTVGGLFNATTKILFQMGLIPVFTFFFLFYRTKTAYFIFRLVGKRHRPVALKIMREVTRVTTRYLGGLMIVVAILAVLNTLGLVVLGVKHALVFGVLAGILNLVPYVGSFLGGFFPVIYVFFTYPNPFKMMVKVAIYFIIVQLLESYVFTPNIVGNNIRINPLSIILALLISYMIWGVPGMMIVVPFLAIMKIIMRNIDSLRPFAYLISDRGAERYRIRFKRKKKE